jgi:hypothetical protein
VDDGCVNREDLLATLRHAEGQAVETFIALLTDPDFVVRIEGDWERPAVTANLLTIYRRRASHVRRVGLPTLGFDETVQRLESTSYEQLRLVAIDGPERYPWCLLFASPELTEIVAALAVTGPKPE